MPIYEFRCQSCRKVVSVFQRRINTAVAARCDGCGGDQLERMMSSFAFRRSVDFSTDGFDESMMDGLDENDPRAMARWARQMGDQMGQDMGPDFDDMIGRMEAGELPDDGGMDDDGFDDDF